jgi:hypothetical protein
VGQVAREQQLETRKMRAIVYESARGFEKRNEGELDVRAMVRLHASVGVFARALQSSARHFGRRSRARDAAASTRRRASHARRGARSSFQAHA